jgi:DNA invertase Pin-like site-specific DNA recombinase
MLIGYARVSRNDQDPALQIDALNAAGCERIFEEKMSGSHFDRPEFVRMLKDVARKGDTIIVWKLDRLGRSLIHLIETVMDLEARGIELVCLTGHFDTTTPSGKLIFHIFAALAEFERAMIIERTKAGLDAARARGKRGGRPKATDKIPAKNLARAKELYAKKEMKIEEIMIATGIPSKSTFYQYVVHGGE